MTLPRSHVAKAEEVRASGAMAGNAQSSSCERKGGSLSKQGDRSAFSVEVAPRLVAQAVGALPTWRGRLAMSQRVSFFGDEETLAVVAWEGGSQDDADQALAWGLAYSQDRDLALILPESFAPATLQRAPWVDLPLKVFTFNSDSVVAETIAPARLDVLDTVRTWGIRESGLPASLNQQHTTWLAPLTSWVSDHPLLRARHRGRSMSWHCRGRQVLSIRWNRTGITILAGVRYSSPRGDQLSPLPPVLLDGPIDDTNLRALLRAVEEAVDRRESAADTEAEESRLQEALADAPQLLGLRGLCREYPVYRPGRRSGFVDFLGVDSRQALHIVETKLGNDPMLALQGLDYWVWVTAHRFALAEQLGADPARGAVIDFVCGSKRGSAAVGPYTARQLEGLDRSIVWQTHIAEGWRTGLALTTLPRRTIPSSTHNALPAMEPRYSARLQDHLLDHESPYLRAPASPIYSDSGGGILAEARVFWNDLSARGVLHRYANHVRSSQAFAVNLFGALGEDGLRSLFNAIGVDTVSGWPPHFEYEDDMDLLGEVTAASPHQTQIDVALDCLGQDGLRTLVAVEVKLSERDFSHCQGFESAKNDRRDICRRPGAFGGDTDACFLLRNYGRGDRRRYDLVLGPVPTPSTGCAFRCGLSQPMRSVALLEAMIAAERIDRGVYALTAPRDNSMIWRRWSEAKAAFAGSSVQLVDVPAEDVLAHMPTGPAEILRRRYRI